MVLNYAYLVIRHEDEIAVLLVHDLTTPKIPLAQATLIPFADEADFPDGGSADKGRMPLAYFSDNYCVIHSTALRRLRHWLSLLAAQGRYQG